MECWTSSMSWLGSIRRRGLSKLFSGFLWHPSALTRLPDSNANRLRKPRMYASINERFASVCFPILAWLTFRVVVVSDDIVSLNSRTLTSSLITGRAQPSRDRTQHQRIGEYNTHVVHGRWLFHSVVTKSLISCLFEGMTWTWESVLDQNHWANPIWWN
jgi:hypothetical protein